MEISTRLPPRRVRAMLGEVMMIGADIEMLLCLAICKLDGNDPLRTLGKLSRKMYQDKIRKLRSLVAASGETLLKEQSAKFEHVHEPFVDLRNTVAHGRYFGRYLNCSIDMYMFLNPADTDRQEGEALKIMGSMEPRGVGMPYQNTTEAMISAAVKDGRKAANNLVKLFDLKHLHEVYPAAFMDIRPFIVRK